MAAFSILYTFISILVAIYGFNSLYLILAYFWTNKPRSAPPPPAEWPKVTIQLPMYNELHTVERLLTSVGAIDYPHDKLEIQVLDDSNDETVKVVAYLVKKLQMEGIDIVHLHRTDQTGFKAGALNEGLKVAKGEYFAVFDADFVPPRDFLRRTIPWFTSPEVGCVQGRWAHTNRDFSLTTRLQALALDAFGIVLQTARARNSLFFQFTGTAGVIRRTCLEDTGGWDSSTLAEDFDFSIHAQMQGWRFEYLPDLEVPAELPVQMAAFKRQQARWSKGAMQTMRKHFLPLLRSSFSANVKIQGLFLLLGYLIFPLILAILLLAWPASLYPSRFTVLSTFITPAAAGAPVLYIIAGTSKGPNWWGRLKLIPAMLLLGLGVSASNSKAVLEGLFSHETGVFLRTPKYALKHPNDSWRGNFYTIGLDSIMWVEALIVGYALLTTFLSRNQNAGIAWWSVIYAMGFIFVLAIILLQQIYWDSKTKESKRAITTAKKNFKFH